jgi:hypothetical protein
MHHAPTMIRVATSLALLLCAAAQAQSVNKCQVDGRAVFQSAPCAIEARVASAAAAPATVTTTAAEAPASPKKKGLADLLRERDGADRGRAQPREFPTDGAAVLRPRMGAV